MQRNKTAWYFLLCILICILPVACDIQKRLYRPGFFIQKKSSLPRISFLPGKYVLGNLPKNTVDESSLMASDSPSPVLLNYIYNNTLLEKAKDSLQAYIESKKTHDNGMLLEAQRDKVIVPLEEGNNNTGKVKSEVSNAPTRGKEKTDSVQLPAKDNEYENLILAFLAGAGSILLLLAIRSGIKKYIDGPDDSISKANEAEKAKKEIADMADRLNRCADRFANAKNERVELAARKVANAINKCNNLGKAKELEKAFKDIYLSPSQASSIQYLKLHNLLSNDMGYVNGNGTLKPDVVTTTGGYYANSAGSLSWTMGEPISETITDTSNTLTQGFQQGSYLAVSVVDEVAQPKIKITAYPNPVTSLLNIRSSSNDPFRAEIIDLQGNIVYEHPFENGQGQIDLSNLSDTMYLLGICDKYGNRIKVFKIQKVD